MKLLTMLFFGLFSLNAHAFPQAPFDALKSNIVPPVYSKSAAYDFEGIVKLSNCSGSLVHFIGQPLDANALVLTNGHCLGGSFLRPGEVITNKEVNRRMRVADKDKRFHSITAEKIIYATMTGTDAALYQLKETYLEIEAMGVTSLEMSDVRPLVDTDIEIVSGYWERGYTCHVDGFVHELHEASWIFTDSIRYSNSGCETIGGTSGSPIIEKGTRIVVGVNNTGNESGERCTMNNPCEVDENGETQVREGASYGQQTYIFYSCLNENYEIDLTRDECALAK